MPVQRKHATSHVLSQHFVGCAGRQAGGESQYVSITDRGTMKSRAFICAALVSSVGLVGAIAPGSVEAKTYKKPCSAKVDAKSLTYVSGNNYGAEVKKLEKQHKCTIPRG
jgi:hypothetical protein